MANYNPPLENLPIFDNGLFVTSDLSLTVEKGDKRYLKFPNAQGTENLLEINVAGVADFLSGMNIIDNTSITNIDQVGSSLVIDNNVNSGTIQMNVNNSSGVQSSPFTVSSTIATLSSQNCNINATGSVVMNTPTLTFNSTNPPTCSAVQPASTDSTTKIPTTAWVQSALAGATSYTPILSSVGYYPAFNKTIGTWQTYNTTSNTQFVDIYTMAGGGALGNTATNPTLGWSKGIGGSGGGGGMVLNSRVSLGGYNNALAVLIQPQFVCATTNSQGQTTNTNYTNVWTGTFTQSNTTITLTSTLTGVMSVGTILYYTKSAFDSAYPSATTPYGGYFNQLQIVSGSGTSWQVQSQQSQTLATAVSATGYTPEVVWSGTFTQVGNVVTAVTTTSGTFFYDSNIPSYLVCTGTANNTQFLTATSGSDVTVNTSQTVSTAIAGRILYVRCGPNVSSRFWSYGAGVNNAYSFFPFIAWCEGGFRGSNGSTNGAQEFGGQGGFGGTVVSYLPYGAQVSAGAKGQNGGVNDDPSGFTKISGQGGVSILTNGKTMTINSLTTPALYQYNQGASSYSPSAFAVNITPASQGGMVLVCYKN